MEKNYTALCYKNDNKIKMTLLYLLKFRDGMLDMGKFKLFKYSNLCRKAIY